MFLKNIFKRGLNFKRPRWIWDIEWIWDRDKTNAVRVQDISHAYIDLTDDDEPYHLLLGSLSCDCFYDAGRYRSREEAISVLENTIGTKIVVLPSSVTEIAP
jgi:hypothetical protein